MDRRERTLIPRSPFNFTLTTAVHRRFKTELVDLAGEGRYQRLFELRQRPFLVSLVSIGTLQRPQLAMTVVGEEIGDGDLAALEVLVKHMFGLEVDILPFYHLAQGDRVLQEVTEALRGLRVPLRASLFETLVTAITSQQVALPFAMQLKARLVQEYGRREEIDGRTYYAFPSPKRLAWASPERLRELKYSYRKAGYILDLAHRVASGEVDLTGLEALPKEETLQRLTSLPGVGRWTVEYALARCLGHTQVIPADDAGLRRAVSKLYFGGERITAEQVRELAIGWQPYQSYAAFYLLQYMAYLRGLLPALERVPLPLGA